ncbi:hypothetical protein [Pseudomonas syringae group sp. J309-1]|uniref:hypothetical protein n=1 Tax=Pseudomonas syringae group sp. J309-1 TaxID=3079588 RepID=UPI00290A5035|nr:hypothetical protein [Pseudomonas syringae group sp. J309-1]MDU8360625.1 hypothetical protein [Pseudomonas syringae group sp. J309-1]
MDTQPKRTPERIASSISNVVDSQGVTVPNGDTTSDTVLTLSGSGNPSSVVFIFDNGALLTTASVTINGTWRFTETVVQGQHTFTVRDGLGGVDSPAWVVTVGEAAVTPEITRIEDASGNEIPNGGTTDDNSMIIVYGTASPNQQVELFDYAASAGPVNVDSSGDWRYQAWGLSFKGYSLTAKGLYGSFPESDKWDFTVIAVTVPTISIILDAAGVEIPEGGTTPGTSVTVIGSAAVGQQVEVFDGANSLGTVVATGGNWRLPVASLTIKAYSIKAVGLYGSLPESAVRAFSVVNVGRENFEGRRMEVIHGGESRNFSDGLVGVFTALPGAIAHIATVLTPFGAVPGFGLLCLILIDFGRVDFQFGRMIANFKFQHAYNDRGLCVLTFYDAEGGVILEHNLVQEVSGVSVEFKLPRPCARCAFVRPNGPHGNCCLDNFEWY